MKRFVTLIAVVVLSAAWTGAPAMAQATSQPRASVAEQYLFAAANAERAQRGLPTLRWDDALYRAALNHAREMAARQTISHQFPGELELGDRGHAVGARFSVISENVAEAQSATIIHDAWMHSEGHRANLLDGQVDSVGISVVSRNGQLYAVEDFDRSVRKLSFDQQEAEVGDLLRRSSSVTVLPTTDEARRTCEMETGFAGARPSFVMRFTAGDLTNLPDALKQRLDTGKYHQAVVGACAARNTQSFSAFNIAVLLYP